MNLSERSFLLMPNIEAWVFVVNKNIKTKLFTFDKNLAKLTKKI